MENKKEDDAVREHIARIVRPIFEKAVNSPDAQPKNRMSVGGSVGQEPKHIIYFPHNYRLYMDFSRKNFLIKPTSEGSVQPPFKIWNSKEIVLEGFNDCTIIVKKNCIQINNFIEHDKKFRLPLEVGTYERLIEIDAIKVRQSKEVLKLFIEKYGGESTFTLIGLWHEYKYWGESFIDSLPQKMRWHTNVSKKVYREGEQSNIEFWDGTLASNFVDMRALDNKVPQIESSLAEIKAITGENLQSTSSFRESLKMLREEALDPLAVQNKWLGENIISHKEVLGGIKDGIEEEVKVRKETLAVFKGIKKALPVKKRKRKSSIRISALEKAFDVIKRERLKSIKKAYKEAFGHDFW